MEVLYMSKIQDIFNSTSHSTSMSYAQTKAFYAIKNCQTPLLGKHINQCPSCNHTEILNNSCRNRNCPICQKFNQEKWVQNQLSKLLPVPYFHVVFTVPDKLNSIFLQNQSLMYSLLIKTAGDTITELAADSKYLHAQVGATIVLHTWGQNLSFHPHVHCIVPGGGLSLDGLRFINSKKKFFIPVKVLSSKFKGKFLYHLKNLFNKDKLSFFNEALKLKDSSNFQALIDSLYDIDWVAFCKKPFKTPFHMINYLGRYTHRVAISDARIIESNDENVSFKYKDYKDHSKPKVMKLSKQEFVRRFLLHILPSGFTKIRHYGILSSRNLKTKLLKLMQLKKIKPTTFKPKRVERICSACGHIINLLDGFSPSIISKSP
jgi:hypothetical protein